MNITDRNKAIIKLLIRILITTVLLIWVFSRIDLQQFLQTIKTARWGSLIAVWGLAVTMFLINSMKMRFILRAQGCNVRVATLFGATAVTFLYSMIMPEVLSTGMKWYILKKDTGKGSNVLSSMIYNQLSVMIIMTVSGLTALIITNPAPMLIPNTANQWLLPVICGVLLAIVILVSLILLNSRTGPKIVKSLGYLFRPFPAKIRQKGEKIPEQIVVFQTVGWRFHLIITSIVMISSVIGTFFIYVLAAKAARITIPIGVFIWLSAAVYLLGRLPISVANLGVREVTLVGALALYGVDAPSALLMSMIIFSIIILMAIIGAFFQLYWAFQRPEKNKQG